jgi:hypothetical protein
MSISVLIIACAIGQPGETDALRAEYLADAEKYAFHHDPERLHELKRHDRPIMRWANDDAWSGDVFVWTHAGRPEVVGCILSGPIRGDRLCYHEFHLLAAQPIAPADLLTNRRWQPEQGLPVSRLKDAPLPAESAGGRLVQMRQMCRDFSAHMEADGEWELRLLPQPLFRYGDAKSAEATGVVDGALFAYVWTKGTDPELILLLECRQTDVGPAWHYAPVRFSNRSLWLQHAGQEVWRVGSHREPSGSSTAELYTTAYARRVGPATAEPQSKPEPAPETK